MKKIYVMAIMAILITATVTAFKPMAKRVIVQDDPMSNWCEGTDFDRSGHVEEHDFNYFRDWYGEECNRENNFCEGSDLMENGYVDIVDFVFFSQHWNMGLCYE